MANTSKGKTAASKKKSPAKSVSGKASSVKTDGGRTGGQKPKIVIIDEQAEKSKRQLHAVIMFAVALFFGCLTLIPGENFWAAMRTLVLGLFGYCSFVFPVLLMYISVMQAMDKDKTKLSFKIYESVFSIIFICAAFHIFSYGISGVSLWQDIKQAYSTGINEPGGGVFGAILGGILLKLFGKTGAGVTILILIFVALMLTTSTTLVKLFNTVKKPVKNVKLYSEVKAREFTQKDRPNKARFDIDVDLGSDAPGVDIFADDEEAVESCQPVSEEKPRRSRVAKPVEDITKLFDEDASQEKTEEKIEEKSDEKAEEHTAKPALDDIIKKAAAAPQTSAKSVSASEPAKSQKTDEFDEGMKKEVNDNYKLPPVSLLKESKKTDTGRIEDELKANAEKLVETLKSFGVMTKIVDICAGPSVTRYELQPQAGVKISKIINLADDIALNLATSGVRIAPVIGKTAIGIEVPNKTRQMVTAREIIDTEQFRISSKKSKLNVALGKDIGGHIMTTDLAKMPHLLIAGTTGSGKSVCINAMIVSLLYNAKPDEVKLLMVDPKQVEFTVYNGIPHLLVPVVSDPHKASGSLGWAVKEMLQRYKLFSNEGVRNIQGYNEQAEKNPELKKMPHIVIFIDEFSDLMMAAPKEIEDSICRLAQMARAAGMHLVIATQRPSVDVITGLIKANIPSRLSLYVSDAMQSRIILDSTGAETLLGNGDLLFSPVGSNKPTRIQGCYLSDEEVANIVDFIKNQGNADYDEEINAEIERQAAAVGQSKTSEDGDSEGGESGDDRLDEAIKVVVETGQASTTLIQRKLAVGYARAARIVDQLEERGIIGPYEGSKPRKVIMTKQQWMERMAMGEDAAVSENNFEEE